MDGRVGNGPAVFFSAQKKGGIGNVIPGFMSGFSRFTLGAVDAAHAKRYFRSDPHGSRRLDDNRKTLQNP